MVLALGGFLANPHSAVPQQHPEFPADDLFVEAVLPPDDALGVAAGQEPLSPRGTVNALVVFAQFRGEAGGDISLPPWAGDLLNREIPGSLTHFYDTMSFGQLQVQGEMLPHRYISKEPASAYLADSDDQFGRYREFVREILDGVDAEVDLGQFDNDGADGLPNSGDDDGVVDYVFIIMRSTPARFIRGGTEGIAALGGLRRVGYNSADASADGKRIYVSGARSHGSIVRQTSFDRTVGIMAHEFGHGFDLPDLYDLDRETPSEDSGGIGRWGLMGRGAVGWESEGPAPLSAWSREFLGWIGRDNERLVEVRRDTTVRIAALNQDGAVYKIPLGEEIPYGGVHYPEYLLLEQRVRSAHRYDRRLIGEGLLIWHVRLAGNNERNNQEELKLVDLVCADGLFEDAGFPLGKRPDRHNGRDNLDFWSSQDSVYRGTHEGNLGDASDPFDGEHYTLFRPDTNPSTDFGTPNPGARSGLRIRMRRQGLAVVADIEMPRWGGTIEGEVYWHGDILVDGDLTIAPEGRLVIYGPAQVRLAGNDRLESGRDPRRCEIHVDGALLIEADRWQRKPSRDADIERVEPGRVLFESLIPGESWSGIFHSASGNMQLPDGLLELRGSDYRSPTAAGTDAGAGVATAVLEDRTREEGEADGEDPLEFALDLNYPNPFADQTTLPYSVAEPSQVQLTVYNSLGQLVRELVDDHRPRDRHEAVWDGLDDTGRSVASGMYLARMVVPGKFSAGRKMLRLPGFGLSKLDEQLRGEGGGQWSAVVSKLTARPAAALGIAAPPSSAQVAYTLGAERVNLRALVHYGEDAERLRQQVGVAIRRLRFFADSARERQGLDDLAAKAQIGREEWPTEIVDRLEDMAETLVWGHSEEAAALYHLGARLQQLTAVVLTARHLDVPLSEVSDPASQAVAMRHLREYMVELGIDEPLIGALPRLETVLAAGAPNAEEAQAVLNKIARPLRIR